MPRASILSPVLIAGCAVLILNFGIRASFGVFQIPIAAEFGWPRADFSMAIAVQNLAWGLGQPAFGALAEKYGDRLAVASGALLYSLGLVLASMAMTPGAMQATQLLVGFGIAGTGFGLVLAIVGRAARPEQRSLALGIATGIGSAGQIAGAPVAEMLLRHFPWQDVFLIFAAAILVVVFSLPFLRATPLASRQDLQESLGTVLLRSFKDPSYAMIAMGFFSCGYQLGFLTAHFPALVTERCSAIAPGSFLASIGISTTSALGAVAIATIGLFNIGGSIFAGALGRHLPKKYLLAGIYAARTIASAVFILLPITPLSVLVFSAVMGSLWLATVPLTSGLVAHLYGLRYMGTLYGFVFLSHQVGSFLGIWLGGRLYDAYGSYSAVWWLGVAVGAFSALIHLPIREGTPRLQAA